MNAIFRYNCTIIRVIDGDTVEAWIDLGFDCWYRSPVRLKGINAPELRGVSREDGEASRFFLAKALEGVQVVVETEWRKDKDKYGRVLGTFWANGININQLMVERGLAMPYMV